MTFQEITFYITFFMVSKMEEILKREDITDNIIIIKINKSYKSGMDAEHLYDVTRGCWKVSIPYASQADYALSVVFGEVKEVYKIFEWVPASEERRKTIEYDAEIEKGRIIFKGEVAPDNIRQKYLYKNVKGLYKRGEANPVKVFMA